MPVNMTRQIIALGGGGFSMEPENPLLDHYVLQAAGVDSPRITLVPTASGDAADLIAKFYTSFNHYDCRPRHLPLFRQPVDLHDIFFDTDIIYVSGGNTRNMLAIWRAAGVDQLMREAWERGIVLAGVSAGAICWFEQGHTDSTGGLSKLDCMGWLPGSCSPHYDGEVHRQPSYEGLQREGGILPGLAMDDSVAAHYIDTERTRLVSSRPHARAFAVAARDGEVVSTPLSVDYLG
jgi:peptidase E